MPLLMTAEIWWAAFTMPPWKVLLFFLLNYPVLVILENYSGFREDFSWFDELEDALVATGIGLLVSAAILSIFNLVNAAMSAREIVGRIVLESIPISIGVSVAISQLGKESPDSQRRKKKEGFWGHIAVAIAGSIYFGFNVAPTLEPLMLGIAMEWWQTLLLLALSIGQVYAILYALEFKGSADKESLFGYTFSIYAVSLLVSAYLLWIFGTISGDTGAAAAIQTTVALGYAASLGAAAANLIL